MLTIKNETNIAEIFISGDIVDDEEGGRIRNWRNEDTTGIEFPAKLKAQLDAVKDKPLEIHINSYGGSVFAGVAMANFIANHKAKTTAIIDGIAASIATQIFFSADECRCPSNAYLMIHKPFTYVAGNADELRKSADILDTLQNGLEVVYKKKAKDGVTVDEIREMMNAETWFTGEKAAEKFQIELLEPVKSLNAISNIEKLRAHGIKIPSELNFENLQSSSDAETLKKILKKLKEKGF